VCKLPMVGTKAIGAFSRKLLRNSLILLNIFTDPSIRTRALCREIDPI
jgi:hypothetical protein